MATVSNGHSPVKPNGTPRPVSGFCRLFVEINGAIYRLKPLEANPAFCSRAWKLTKSNGDCYHVHLGERGAECECMDFLFRRLGKDRKGCKHIAALRALGLLS